jgi:hypothetical protein
VRSPAAERAVVRAVRDAIHFSLGASRRLFGDEALIASPTSLVHIEEGDEIAFLERLSLNIGDRAANLFEMTNRDMPRYNGIRYASELTVQQMHVGPAYLRVQRA